MLRVNLTSGQTRSFDLEDPDQSELWMVAQGRDEFQADIRAISVVTGTHVHTFPRPSGNIKPVIWAAQLVRDRETGRVLCEQVACYFSDFALIFTVHRGRGPIKTRFNVKRVGKLRLRPPTMDVG